MGSSQLKATPQKSFTPEQNRGGVGLDAASGLLNPPRETRQSITDILKGENPGDEVTINSTSGDVFGSQRRPTLAEQTRAFATSETSSAPPSLQQQFTGFQDAQPTQMIEPPQAENAQEASSSLLAKAMKRIGGQPATPKAEATGTTPTTPELSAPATEETKSAAPKLAVPDLAEAAQTNDQIALALARAEFEQLAAQLSQQAAQLGAQEQIIAATAEQTPDSHIGVGLISSAQKTIISFAQKIIRKKSLSALAVQELQAIRNKKRNRPQLGNTNNSVQETTAVQDLNNKERDVIGA